MKNEACLMNHSIIISVLYCHVLLYYIYMYFIGNDSVTDKIKEFERDIGLTFVDSNEVDSEDSVRFVKHVETQTSAATGSPALCVRKCGEGTCVFDSRNKQTCQCPFGKTGSSCQISKY